MISYYVYLLVQTSSFLVCLYLYKSLKNTELRYFLPFLFLTLVVELTGLWMTQHGIKNYLLFNVFTTFEFIFYSFLFYKHYRKHNFKVLSLAFMPLYIIAVFINLMYFQGIEKFHTYTFLLGSFLLSFFVACFFMNLFCQNIWKTRLQNSPFSGFVLVYYFSTLVL